MTDEEKIAALVEALEDIVRLHDCHPEYFKSGETNMASYIDRAHSLLAAIKEN